MMRLELWDWTVTVQTLPPPFRALLLASKTSRPRNNTALFALALPS